MSVAIIGMACRFPGATTPRDFWHNLVHGVESITRLSDAELLAGGVDAQLVGKRSQGKLLENQWVNF